MGEAERAVDRRRRRQLSPGLVRVQRRVLGIRRHAARPIQPQQHEASSIAEYTRVLIKTLVTKTYECMVFSPRRLKLGIKPSRYGNMDGTKRIYYDNMARIEGVD